MHDGVVSRFSFEIFQSHSSAKLSGGIFLCFRKFLVKKKL